MSKVNNLPELSFNISSKSWNQFMIQELVDNQVLDKPMDGNHGNIHPVSSDFVAEGIPFVMANDLSEKGIDLTSCKRIKKSQADSLQKGFSKSGDILLSHKGSVGQTAIVPQLNTEYIMLTPQVTYYRVLNRSKLYSKFLLQAFRSSKFQKRLKVLADGGTRPYIGITEQRKLLIDLPCIEEQQKIAGFLSSVDKKIEQLSEKYRLLTEYKKGVMQQIFTQQIRFKDDNGNDYPEWEEKRLGSLVEIMNGLTYSPDDIVEDGLLVLRSSNIKNGRLVFTDNVFVNVEVKKTAYTQENDILVCVRNGSKRLIGKNVLVKGSFAKATHGAFMTVLRGDSNEFLSHWFQMGDYYKQVHQNLGATINSINGSDLKKFKLSIPPSKEERQKIANFLTEIDHKINQAWSTLEQTKAFKKGLLQKMFI